MPSVRISDKKMNIVEALQHEIEQETGFRPDKKDVVEQAVMEYYEREVESDGS